MKSRLVILVWIAIAYAAQIGRGQDIHLVHPSEVGLSEERLGRVEQCIQDYIDQNKIAGAVSLIARKGGVAFLKAQGLMDIADRTPMQTDTIFRIASMTKAITSVAVMQLYEEGKFLLSDPISKYIPEFKNPMVLVVNPEGSNDPYTLVPANREITIRQLLNHTSGISYPFQGRKYLYELYNEAGITNGISETPWTTGDMIKALAKLPLYHQPGEASEYGLSTDVLGYLIEVVSGQTLDHYFQEHIFDPLGMPDTHFYLPKEKLPRFASVYTPDEQGGIKELPEGPITMGTTTFSTSFHYNEPKTYLSGGGGLASTIGDYYRFLRMMLNNGELNGKRVLSRKSVELMTCDQLGSIEMFFRPTGYTFGLGFAINQDLGASGQLGSEGEYNWGGFYYTLFWVDPKEEMIGIFMSQLYPSNIDLQQKFKVLAYQAIAD